LGTFEFYVLLESIRREKREKAAFAKFLADLAVETGKIEPEKATFLLMQYEEELHQFKYNYKYVTVEERLGSLQVDVQDEEKALLEKVSGLTVSDENAGRNR